MNSNQFNMMPTAIQPGLSMDNNQSGMMPNPGQHDSLMDNSQSNMMPTAIQHDLSMAAPFQWPGSNSQPRPNNNEAGYFTRDMHMSKPNPNNQQHFPANTDPAWFNPVAPTGHGSAGSVTSQTNSSHSSPDMPSPDSVVCQSAQTSPEFHYAHNSNNGNVYGPGFVRREADRIERRLENHGAPQHMMPLPSNMASERKFHPMINNMPDFNPAKDYAKEALVEPGPSHLDRQNNNAPGIVHHQTVDQANRKRQFGQYYDDHEQWKMPRSSKMQGARVEGATGDYNYQFRQYDAGVPWQENYNYQGYPVQGFPGTTSQFLKNSSHEDQTSRKNEFGEYQMPREGDAYGPNSSQMNATNSERTGSNLESEPDIRSLNGTGAPWQCNYNNQGLPGTSSQFLKTSSHEDQTSRKNEFGEYQMPLDGDAYGQSSSQMNGANLERTGLNLESQWEIRSLNGTGAQGRMSYNNQGYPVQEHGAFNNQGLPGTSSQFLNHSSHEDQTRRKNEFGVPRQGAPYEPNSSQMNGANLERPGSNLESQWEIRSLNGTGAQWQCNYNNQGLPGTSSQFQKTSAHEDQTSGNNEFGGYEMPREGDAYGPNSSQMHETNFVGTSQNMGPAGAQWQENPNNNQVQEHDTSKNPNITPLSTHLSDAFIALDAHLESTNRTGPEEQALTGNNSQILQKNAPQDSTANNPIRFEMNGNNFNPDQANTSCQDLENGDNATTQPSQSVPDKDVHLGLEDLDWKYPDGECNFETCSNNIAMIEPLKEIEAERGPVKKNNVPVFLQQIIDEEEASSQETGVVQNPEATKQLASMENLVLTEEEKKKKANCGYSKKYSQKIKDMRESYERGTELLPVKILGPQHFWRRIEKNILIVGEACPRLLCRETDAYEFAMKELDKKFADQKSCDVKLIEAVKGLAVEKEKFEKATKEYEFAAASRKSSAKTAAVNSETVHTVLDSQPEVVVENKKFEEPTKEYDRTKGETAGSQKSCADSATNSNKGGTWGSQKTRAKHASAHWENVIKVLDLQWTLLYETKLAGLAVLYLQRTMSILIPKLNDVEEQCHQQGKDQEFKDFMEFLREHRRLFMVPRNNSPSGSTGPIKLPNR